jgi:hypothetical protein
MRPAKSAQWARSVATPISAGSPRATRGAHTAAGTGRRSRTQTTAAQSATAPGSSPRTGAMRPQRHRRTAPRPNLVDQGRRLAAGAVANSPGAKRGDRRWSALTFAPRCCSCLIATATVLELPPIGSSHAPTSCLCTRCKESGQVALLLVVQRGSAEAGASDAPAWDEMRQCRLRPAIGRGGHSGALVPPMTSGSYSSWRRNQLRAGSLPRPAGCSQSSWRPSAVRSSQL